MIETLFYCLLIIERFTLALPPPKNCGYIKYISTNYSSEIGFDWQNGGTFIQTWSLVEISNICKNQKWQNPCADILPDRTNYVFP